ncbi:MAG: cation:proton antiporter [Synechococcaceae cyanobacterium]|nr:cation:proton antiporter [Synechococcaceae cyanobacterium]
MGSLSLLAILLMLLVAVLATRLLEGVLLRLAIPGIVLELLLGFVLGNTVLPHSAIAPVAGIAELGVLTLFFLVGLEARGNLLANHRGAIVRTVAISALAPLLAFWPLQRLFGLDTTSNLLCLAVLSATGTGVTLRVLARQQALDTPSGRLLVGVSILDDLPAIGLLSLASLSAGRSLSGGSGAPGMAALGGLLLAGFSCWMVRLAARRGAGPWKGHSLPPLLILLLLIGPAWVAETCGLTSLLGALWGGVLLARLSPVETEVRQILALLSDVFLPIYFISVGMRIEASALQEPRAWTLAAALIVLAVLTKLACGLGIGSAARQAGVDPWLVVTGLLPRGLPGLVFATTALTSGLITGVLFSALVLMVSLSTVLGLLLLERRLRWLRRTPTI